MARRSGPTLVQRSRRVNPQQKAIYHQVEGAGPSRVRREFLGLTARDIAAISTRLEAGIRRTVDRRF
jgi:hypothetical protein